jgi:hypothetical protein
MGDWKILSGGSFLDLANDYGFKVEQMHGAGMPPVSNISRPYGILDGALFQRTRTEIKQFTLTGTILGEDIEDLFSKREAIINLVRPDLYDPQEPVVLQFTGASVTKQASAYFDGGLELGDVERNHEKIALTFVQFDPFWESSGSDGAASLSASLAVSGTLASANYALHRTACGVWTEVGGGSLGAAGKIVISDDSGQFYFGTDNNNTYGEVQIWGGSGTSLSPLGGSIASGCGILSSYLGGGQCWTLTLDGNDHLWIGGYFRELPVAPSGDLGSIVRWDGTAFHPTGSDGASGGVHLPSALYAHPYNHGVIYDIRVDSQDRVVVAGTFAEAGPCSLTASNVARYNTSSSTWEALDGGMTTVSSVITSCTGNVTALHVDADDNYWFGGCFVEVGGSLAASRVAKFDNTDTWNAVGSGVNNNVFDINQKSNGAIVLGGFFTATGGTGVTTLGGVAEWNGTVFRNLSASTAMTYPGLFGVTVDDNDDLIVSGKFTEMGGLAVSDGFARLTSSTWKHIDGVDLPGAALVQKTWAASGTLTVVYDTTGTATTSAVTTVTNEGTADAYPIITISGSGKFYHIKNYTTDDHIYFDVVLAAGETLSLDLRAGVKSLTSSTRGNMTGKILPGSDVSTFKLKSGSNSVACFSENSTASVTITYTERYWGA